MKKKFIFGILLKKKMQNVFYKYKKGFLILFSDFVKMKKKKNRTNDARIERGSEIEYYKTCLQAFRPIITNTVTSKTQLPFVETGEKNGLQYRDNWAKEAWVKQAENTENLTDGGFVKQGALDC